MADTGAAPSQTGRDGFGLGERRLVALLALCGSLTNFDIALETVLAGAAIAFSGYAALGILIPLAAVPTAALVLAGTARGMTDRRDGAGGEPAAGRPDPARQAA